MMAAAAEDSCRGGQWRQTRIAADDNSTQNWVTDYGGEGQKQAANNNGINIGIWLNMKPARQISDK